LSGWLIAALVLGAGFFAVRYAAGIVRLRRGLERVARGELDVPLVLDLPRGLRAAERDIRTIADRQRELGRQAESERFDLAAILGSIFEGVILVDRGMRIRLANPGVSHMFRLKLPPAGRTVMEAFRSLEMHQLIRQAVEGGTAQLGEVTWHQEAAPRVFELSVTPLTLEDGHRGAVAVVHDITKIRGLERVRREFVANVSHELRTPLTIINGYLETLLDGGAEDRVMTEGALKVMFKHADRLKHLVDDLLTISQAESRAVPLDLDRIALPDLLHRVVEQFDQVVREHDVKVRIAVAGNDLVVEADEVKLEQVFVNLLENALKYGQRPGLIVALDARRSGPDVHIRVSDNGPGIPFEDQEHVFERFYRVHKHRSRDTGGTGLGLSIVKNVVQAHGGRVSLESTPGSGSTFHVVLPVSRTGGAPAAAAA
jgi:two-component system phosphate regulon sensor histidine kinase PhoR